MADEIRATPRVGATNQLLGLLADTLQGGSNFASKPFGYDNPPVRGLLELLGVPAVTNTLNELSYGGALGIGSGITYRPKADTLDAAMAVAPLLGGMPRAINAGAAAIGQRLEPSVNALVNKTMAQGGRPAQMLGDLAQGTVSPMTVWHGSPHQFSKFDASKIGTGEGAQAYGHGLYLAESPDVAKSYTGAGGVSKASETMLRGRAEKVLKNPDAHAASDVEWAGKTLEQLNSRAGNQLYKVDLPDDQIAKMLDWDKPLSQQHPDVQAALKMSGVAIPDVAGVDAAKLASDKAFDAWFEAQKNGASPLVTNNLKIQFQKAQSVHDGVKSALSKTGSDAYRDLQHQARDYGIDAGRSALTTQAASQAKAAEDLRAFGIPGIRYLDGGSRGAGAGSSNFVVFPGNEDMLTILERNGQPVNALRGLLDR